MSYNVLGARRTRQYARLLGIPFDRIITRGGSGHTFHSRTIYHEHGTFYHDGGKGWVYCPSLQDQVPEWRYDPHWTSCKEQFPEDFEGYPPYRYIGPRGSDWLRNGV